MDPTPENLSRACGLSVEDARMLMAIKSLPAIFGAVALVCRALRVRMLWMSDGTDAPMLRTNLRAEELELLELAENMDARELRAWIRTGRHLIKS